MVDELGKGIDIHKGIFVLNAVLISAYLEGFREVLGEGFSVGGGVLRGGDADFLSCGDEIIDIELIHSGSVILLSEGYLSKGYLL